ncbi:AMP-binding protein [Streptomyces sp. RB6PN25]|uniref:AMP-binding protein n=1 Tax=Streptomyces humicola TaxID=2953240 RepID=A0ABT1PSL6_9ACTN|nr:AMP-binding protein [Streptomyces humicola]MCQ4080668.1 AMP-binding protein [Streptomyces humicola]
MSAALMPGRMLRRRAAEVPGAVPYGALPGVPLAQTASCCYAELDRRARAVAARLGGALPPGSRVLLAYRQGPDLAGALYGCLYAGMVAVPYLLAGAQAGGVAVAVERVAPAAVLTSADGWSPLPVNRDRVPVLEADGEMVGGRSVWKLAEWWRPVGVLRDADAYRRFVPGAPGDRMGGRLEPAFTHGDLLGVLRELADASRLGAGEEELGWIASVQGVDDAVWRLLLPVHEGRGVRVSARPPEPWA